MSSVFGWPILLWVCTCVCVGVCVCVCVLYLRFQVTHCLVTWWANNVIVSDGNASNRVINCIRSPLIWFGFICFIHCFLPRGSRKNSSIFYVVSPSYRTSIKSSITGAKFDLLWHGSNFFFSSVIGFIEIELNGFWPEMKGKYTTDMDWINRRFFQKKLLTQVSLTIFEFQLSLFMNQQHPAFYLNKQLIWNDPKLGTYLNQIQFMNASSPSIRNGTQIWRSSSLIYWFDLLSIYQY